MDIIYLNQDKLRIRVTNFGHDISSAQTVLIKVKKPNGTIMSFTATVEDASNGIFYYDLPDGSTLINEMGLWKTWGHVTFNDGREAAGRPFPFMVYEEGE